MDGAPLTPEPRLPPFLMEPPEANAIATLGLHTTEGGELRWRLQGSPRAVVIARRLFDDKSSRSMDALTTPAIRQTFDEIVMLRHRFPIRLTPQARQLWNEWLRDLIDDWRDSLGLGPDTNERLSAYFKGRLEVFQAVGARHLGKSKCTILGDEMGLGKTVQALAAIAQVNKGPALIVAQPHVVDHWMRKLPEFLRIAPKDEGGLTVAQLRGAKPSGSRAKADIYLIHYLLLRGWRDWLVNRGIKVAVFDECQELRVPTSDKYEAAQSIARRATHVWGLSGTPIYNLGIEAHHILSCMSPGILGPRESFKRDWCTPQTDDQQVGHRPGAVVEPAKLNGYLVERGLLLRRREADVMGQLPPLHTLMQDVHSERSTFASLVKEASRIARQASHIDDAWKRSSAEAQALRSARMATGVAKAGAAAVFVRGLVEAGEPVIVFGHHYKVIDTLVESLKDLTPVLITGRQSLAEKAKAQRAFETGLTDVIIIGLRSATGIDGLQHRARSVVFAELDWSPAIHRQGQKRAHRWGQKNAVTAYYLIASLGFDGEIMDLLKLKMQQADRIVGDEEVTAEQIAADEAAAREHMGRILAKLRGMS